MEGNKIKMCKTQVRKVTQEVFKLVWIENGIAEKTKPELSFVPDITAEFLNDLFILVLIESSCNEFVWEDFLKNNFQRMTTTPYLFANYFACASHILIDNSTDVYACFVDILSLLNHFALEYWQRKDKKFLNCCVDLFCAFFDEQLSLMFEKQDSWKNFSEYLKNNGRLVKYKELTRHNKSRTEIFSEFLSSYRESNESYTINGHALKDLNEELVENHKEAVSFADSVGDKVKKVCNKAFEEVLKDFSKTDKELEDLCRKTTEAASGGMASAEGHSSAEAVAEEALENVPRETIPEKSENPTSKAKACDPLNIPVTGSSKSEGQSTQTSSPIPEEYVSIPKSNVERARALLEEMKIDIAKMHELIKFVCEENSIKVPKQVETKK